MLVFLTLCIFHNLLHPSLQILAPATPSAPTHHATVIVPAPVQTALPHHVTVVTMGPASVINTVSTSRQNLDTIVQVRHAGMCILSDCESMMSALFKVQSVP